MAVGLTSLFLKSGPLSASDFFPRKISVKVIDVCEALP